MIGALHIESQFPNPMEHARRLPQLLRGIKRTHSQERRPRLPITPALLLTFRRHLNLLTWDHLVLWTAMLIAFFAFLRSAELIALTTEDVSQDTATAVYMLSIRASKTDPFRKGAHIRLAPSGHPVLCPSETLSKYLQSHIQRRPPPHSLLFRWSSGEPISRQTFSNCIKHLATLAGIDASRYATHSFRIGAAITAAAAGLPDSTIKVMGRWSSEAYQSYIRTLPQVLDSVPKAMAFQP